MTTIEQLLKPNKIIPVVVINDLAAALPLAETLLSVGINTMEITLRTPNALAVMATIAKHYPQMVVGAGTVLTTSDFTQALNAGAKYIIAPGLTTELLYLAQQEKVLFMPGVATPSEAMKAASFGCRHLKFFPAVAYNAYNVMQALASPLATIKFCPTGGITLANMSDYLALPNVFALGLSSIVESNLIAHHDFAEIKLRCEAAVRITKL